MKNSLLTLMFFVCSISFSQMEYKVKAQNGLIIRNQPTTASDKVGKLIYNDIVIIKANSIKKADTIMDNNYKIAGHWVAVKEGYVFDGFLKEIIKGDNIKIKQELLGQVKSALDYVVTYYYDKSKDSLYKGKTDYGRKYIFDEQGYCTEKHESSNKKGSMTLKYKYEYDKYQNLIKETYFSNGKVFSVEDFLYNKKKQRIEKEEMLDGKPFYKETFKYDNEGNIIEEKYYSYVRDEGRRTINTYDVNNNKIESKSFGSPEKNNAVWHYKYNKENKLLKETKTTISTNKTITIRSFMYEYFPNYKQTTHIVNDYLGEIEKKQVDRYDSLENRIEYILYKKGSSKSNYHIKVEHNYAKNSRCVLKLNNNNAVEKKTTNVYDYKDHILRKTESNPHNKEIYSDITYSYVFDKRNNWIEKREHKNGILKQVYVREITYH